MADTIFPILAGDSLAQDSESFAQNADVESGTSGRRERRKDPRPHKCQDCGKGFPRPSALATHMSVHSGEKRE
jgi:uncharacterized Zn-finger protein